jgi:outer membrane protein assembly factor BamB
MKLKSCQCIVIAATVCAACFFPGNTASRQPSLQADTVDAPGTGTNLSPRISAHFYLPETSPAPATVGSSIPSAAVRQRCTDRISVFGEEDADWTNLGGNARRSGQSGGNGPVSAAELWSNDDDVSIIAWHPVILGEYVFAIRQTAFPDTAANDELIAWDLDTGQEQWRIEVPYGGDPDQEWIAHVIGANNGRVYAARGGSGRQTPVYAFDASTGAQVWASEHLTFASPQESAVFAPNGDLIVGDYLQLARIDAVDGSTAWSISRACAVSGNCAAALGFDGVYIDEPGSFNQKIVKIDPETGDRLYESPTMDGMTVQNAPFVSHDGLTVYLARSQNNTATDFLFAFDDTGTALVESWHRPVRWTTSHEHGLAEDGSIYTFVPGDIFVRLNPDNGEITASAGVLAPIDTNLSARTAVAACGTVYVSNGWAGNPAQNGRIWAFPADLSEQLFELTLDRQNSGGPSLGSRATLVVADRIGIRAYRSDPVTPTATPECIRNGDVNLDGTLTAGDAQMAFYIVLGLYSPTYQEECAADCNGDDTVTSADAQTIFLVVLGTGTCADPL